MEIPLQHSFQLHLPVSLKFYHLGREAVAEVRALKRGHSDIAEEAISQD